MSVYLQPRNPIGNLTKLEFPFTPQIEYSHDVKYDAYSLTHTNYQPYAYTRSENPTISMSCKFSAHTVEHFRASERAIRFLRTYTKMNYGRTDPDRGQPPRILRLFAYGQQMFNDVPVVISKFSMTFPEDIDYVQGEFSSDGEFSGIATRNPGLPSNEASRDPRNPSAGYGQSTAEFANNDPRRIDRQSYNMYLPVIFTVNISLLVQQNLSKTVNEFNLNDFASGDLIRKGYI